MAHNLSRKNGRAQMFYVGDVPWHGLGVELKHPATAAEAMAAAQLDYEVDKFSLKAFSKAEGIGIKIADHVATVRGDTKQVLGIVGDGYKIVQNVEAFDFFDSVVGAGQAIYHTAGALGKGERVWLMAKLPKNLILAREDIVEKYLILTNSHDGTSSLKMYFSTVRVVCANTLNLSLKDAANGISIRHSGDISSKAKEAQRILGISLKYYHEFEELCKQLVAYKPGTAEVEGYYDKVVYGDSVKNRESSVLQNRRNDMLHLFEHGKGNDMAGVKGSAWAMVNGVTEYYDHCRQIKGEKEDPTNRLESIWFGNSARAKQEAFVEACKIIA